MKLNFNYCKKCRSEDKYFAYLSFGLTFHCEFCHYFVFEQEERIFKGFQKLEKIEYYLLKQIQNLKIIKKIDAGEEDSFKNCPYQLEHAVDQDETKF